MTVASHRTVGRRAGRGQSAPDSRSDSVNLTWTGLVNRFRVGELLFSEWPSRSHELEMYCTNKVNQRIWRNTGTYAARRDWSSACIVHCERRRGTARFASKSVARYGEYSMSAIKEGAACIHSSDLRTTLLPCLRYTPTRRNQKPAKFLLHGSYLIFSTIPIYHATGFFSPVQAT